MFAKFDEIPAMTLQDIKETKCYGRTDAHMDGHENSIPTTKFAGGKFVVGIKGQLAMLIRYPHTVRVSKKYQSLLSKQNCLTFYSCHFVKKKTFFWEPNSSRHSLYFDGKVSNCSIKRCDRS